MVPYTVMGAVQSLSDYRKQLNSCKKNGCAGYAPDYYYSQVYPLAAFKGFCDKDGLVYNLYGW